MATDYDAPRTSTLEEDVDSLEELAGRRTADTSKVDVDETEASENLEFPGADLSGETLSILVRPVAADEFLCTRCFLVHHRSQLVTAPREPAVCRDCT